VIELRELRTDGQPQHPVRIFNSEFDLIREYGFSLNEIENALLNGTCLQGKYTLDLAPDFLKYVSDDPAFAGILKTRIRAALVESLRETAINEIVADHIGGISKEKVMEFIGLSDEACRQALSRATRKLRQAPNIRKLLECLEEYRQVRYRRSVEIVKKTKITITIKS
jgi:hypothetical protein